VAAGKDAIVQPMIEDMIATIDTLSQAKGARVLLNIFCCHCFDHHAGQQENQADAKEKQKYFERLCRGGQAPDRPHGTQEDFG
jgi:hypothetical protein